MDERDRSAARGRAAVAGVLAAGLALAVAEVVAGFVGGRSLLVAVGDAVIALTPGPVVAFAIDTFGSADRLVLVVSMTLVAVLGGAAIGRGSLSSRWVAPIGFAAFALVGAAAGLTDPFVAPAIAVLAPALGAAAGVVVLQRLFLALDRPGGTVPQGSAGSAAAARVPGVAVGSRREFLTLAGGAVGAVAVLGGGAWALQRRAPGPAEQASMALPRPADPLPPPPAGAALDVEGISPLLTPNDRFYRIDTALMVPRIDPDSHVVRVTGMVDRPLELTYADLVEEADTEADVTLSCVSNEVGGHLVGNARWLGVPLERLLRRAGVAVGASQVVGRSVDGWTAGFPLSVALDGRPALVAVGMNGEPLPARHGFPVRLVIAGLYGYVSDTKWLSEIELTTWEAFDGYWVPRGWAKEGPIKTQSRIDVPRPDSTIRAGTTAVAGVAWAGERGISAVEVSVDDGEWQEATLAEALAETSWRQWVLRWDAEPGRHVLRVRATDGDDATQTAELAPPMPDGATGHHTIRVTVG